MKIGDEHVILSPKGEGSKNRFFASLRMTTIGGNGYGYKKDDEYFTVFNFFGVGRYTAYAHADRAGIGRDIEVRQLHNGGPL